MPLIIVLLVALTTGVYYASENQSAAANDSYKGETEAIAVNMAIYRNAVLRFADNQPAFEGEVPDENLPLPSWFNRFSTVRNLIEGGRVYVYAEHRRGLVSVLDKRFESLTVGIKRGGVLSGPRTAGGAPLPAGIAEGAVVIGR